MNNYLEIRQQLTIEQSAIWQPIEGRKLVVDESEARAILPTFIEMLDLVGETYSANLHICNHESGGECNLIDLLENKSETNI